MRIDGLLRGAGALLGQKPVVAKSAAFVSGLVGSAALFSGLQGGKRSQSPESAAQRRRREQRVAKAVYKLSKRGFE